MSLVLFKEKFDDYEALFKKRKELKEKFPYWVHSVSINKNEITTMTVDSYIDYCMSEQLNFTKNRRNKYVRQK